MEEKRSPFLISPGEAALRLRQLVNSPPGERVVTAAVCFALGLISSKGQVFGRYAPFGISVAAVAPKQGMWYSVLGAVLGYLMESHVFVPARYIAAVIAAAVIRWCLSELKPISTHPLFAPVISFLPLLAPGMALVIINRSQAQTTALYLAESFLGSGCSYFFARTAEILSTKRKRSIFDTTDIASLTISVGVLLLAFSGVSISGISVGRVLMILLIMYCAGCGGISGGTVAGVTAGAIQSLATAGLSYVSGAYGLGGLMAGIFAGLGKIFTAIAFVIAHGVASLQIGEPKEIFIGSFEVGIATIIFMLLPRSHRLSEIFGDRRDRLSGDSLRNNVISRLNFTAEALSHVSTTVEKIAGKLTHSPSFQSVLNLSVSEVCSNCSACAICWRKNKDETAEAFRNVSQTLRTEGRISKEDFPEEISRRCQRTNMLSEAINKNYRDFIAMQAAEVKSAQMRAVTGEQFATTSVLLRDIAREFHDYQHINEDASERISEIFRQNGIFPVEVCCRTDKFGRMTVEAEVERNRNMKLNRSYFTREVSKACGRSFSQPCVSFTDDSCRLMMCQKPELDVAFGYYQHSAGGSNFCGDSVCGFYDGMGHYIAIICDGMGTGGRAAVDGVMTSSIAETLLKAGLGYDTALKLINSALMTKSGDESHSTLDIVSVDLFTGNAEFRKAGAAGTFIRRGRRVEYVEKASLPVGIMMGTEFARFDEHLKENDLVVMVSDGATACGVERIREIIEAFEDDDPEYLSKQIVTEAQKYRLDGHEDDITASAIRIK